jgi:hypothetical protein
MNHITESLARNAAHNSVLAMQLIKRLLVCMVSSVLLWHRDVSALRSRLLGDNCFCLHNAGVSLQNSLRKLMSGLFWCKLWIQLLDQINCLLVVCTLIRSILAGQNIADKALVASSQQRWPSSTITWVRALVVLTDICHQCRCRDAYIDGKAA